MHDDPDGEDDADAESEDDEDVDMADPRCPELPANVNRQPPPSDAQNELHAHFVRELAEGIRDLSDPWQPVCFQPPDGTRSKSWEPTMFQLVAIVYFCISDAYKNVIGSEVPCARCGWLHADHVRVLGWRKKRRRKKTLTGYEELAGKRLYCSECHVSSVPLFYC